VSSYRLALQRSLGHRVGLYAALCKRVQDDRPMSRRVEHLVGMEQSRQASLEGAASNHHVPEQEQGLEHQQIRRECSFRRAQA
jgi:hypothetical protein